MFIMRNENFICENCKKEVSKHPNWSARNHCPFCLYSKHLDKNFPWDRNSNCHWMMKVIWIDNKKNKWIMLKHKCKTCWKIILNKTAPDDNLINFSFELNNNFLWRNI